MRAYLFLFLAAANIVDTTGVDDDDDSEEGFFAEDEMVPEYAEVKGTPVFLNIEVSESSATDVVAENLEAKLGYIGTWSIGKYASEALAKYTVEKDGGKKVVQGVVKGVAETLPEQMAAKGMRMAATEEVGPLGSDRVSLGVLRLDLNGINLPKLGVVDKLRENLKQNVQEQLNGPETGMEAEVEVTADADAQLSYCKDAADKARAKLVKKKGLAEQATGKWPEVYAPLAIDVGTMVSMADMSSCAPMTTAHDTQPETIYMNINVANVQELVQEKVAETWLGPVLKWLAVNKKTSDGGTAVMAGIAAKMVPVLKDKLSDQGICVMIETLNDAACVTKNIGIEGASSHDCAALTPSAATCEAGNCDYAPGVLGSVGPLVVFKVSVLGLDIAKMDLVESIRGNIEGSMAASFAEKGLAATVTAETGEEAQRAWLAGETETGEETGEETGAEAGEEVAAAPKHPPLTRREHTRFSVDDVGESADLPVQTDTALDKLAEFRALVTPDDLERERLAKAKDELLGVQADYKKAAEPA